MRARGLAFPLREENDGEIMVGNIKKRRMILPNLPSHEPFGREPAATGRSRQDFCAAVCFWPGFAAMGFMRVTAKYG